MNVLKIAIINEFWNAGAERCARDLESFLTQRHTVRYYPAPGRDTVESILADLSTYQPDIVHCHSYYTNLPYDFLTTVSHLYPTCFTPHDTRVVGAMTLNIACYECQRGNFCLRCPLVPRMRQALLLNPFFWQRLKQRRIHANIAPSLMIVAPSQWFQQRLMQTELRRFPIQHIPIGIDLERFRPIPDARERLGLPSNKKILLYVAYTAGWITNPYKGLCYLADAFKNVILPQAEDTLLLIAGEGLIPNYRKVKPLGYLRHEQLPLYYSAADICIAPSLADSVNYTVREAMSCGTPVVASQVGGITEAIDDGVTGHLVPPGDSEALGTAILSLLSDTERCHGMGHRARLYAEQHFDLEKVGRQYEMLYEHVISRSELTPLKGAAQTQLKIAIVNESWTAGATRCARDLEKYLSPRHQMRYYPRQEPETLQTLLDDLQEFSPDVVHCHSFYGDFPYRLLSILSRRYPTCFTPHDPRPTGDIQLACWNCQSTRFCFRCPLVNRRQKLLLMHSYFWRRLYKRFIHYRANRNLRIITPSQWLWQRLANTEMKRFRFHCIPYGLDLNHFRPIADAKTHLHMDRNRKIVLYIAHHEGAGWLSNPRKGLLYLADAFINTVLPKYPDALLLVIGERLVPNHPNVQPLGFIPQDRLPLYYSAADIFATPTLGDNLPYTVLEAMGCGTPVVASKVGGLYEEVEDGVTGYLVPPADSEAFGQALLAVLEDSDKAQAMGQAGRARVEELFSMDLFIRRHENLYHHLILTTQNRK